MKVAMWGVGLFIIGLLGLILVNLFGNITVTNQLNYTTMKNAVEASMYDALDVVHFRTGFCLCTEKSKTGNKWVFTNKNEYELLDISYGEHGNEKCLSTSGKEYRIIGKSCEKENECLSSSKRCELLYGEFRVNPQVFSESLTRRFAEMVNNNKDYQIIIQDIIEYPPKVSVRIDSHDIEFSPTESNSGGYEIVNKIDALIETYDIPRPTPTPTPKPSSSSTPPSTPSSTPSSTQSSTPPSRTITPTPTPAQTTTTTPTPVCCYNTNTAQYSWESTGTCGSGSVVESSVTTESACQNACYCKDLKCGIYAIYDWNSKEESKGWLPLYDSNGKHITDSSRCKIKCEWTSSTVKKNQANCPAGKGDASNPKSGDYKWNQSNGSCKQCTNCGANIATNTGGAACITVKSCDTPAPCPPGSSVVSQSCTCTYTCSKKVYTCEAIKIGWIKSGTTYYYYNSSGDKVTGWKEIDKVWYYFDEDGVMVTGWVTDAGKKYYLKSDGSMSIGWLKIGNDYYYFNSSGAMVTGWQEDDKEWYYLNSDGKMVTGWKTIDKKKYYFSSSGSMVTGWKKISDKYYYFDSSGAMYTGWLQEDKLWYYLDSNGVMLTGCHVVPWNGVNGRYLFNDQGVNTGSC